MSTLRLKQALRSAGIRQGELAEAAGISRPALNGLINHGVLPAGLDRADVEQRIRTYVERRGGDTRGLFEVAPPCCSTAVPDTPAQMTGQPLEAVTMLLRRQPLGPQTRRHFGLVRDPFAEPATPDDVFLGTDYRYVRETMYQVARHGGFLAIVGESGAGKSTLREELIERLTREEQAVIVVQPYVLAMEGSDVKGKTLKSVHIAEAVMAAVAPLAKVRSSPEARFAQLHGALRDSARAGQSHVLVIEEAHCLPLATLKHLKRFRELKDGMKPLLAVILLGQPELALKLSEHNPEVREVVQRIEVVALPSLGTDLEGYLQHRFRRVGVELGKVLAPAAVEALRARLAPAGGQSLLYPLAVHNMLGLAMNRAAQLGAPIVDADVIRGV